MKLYALSNIEALIFQACQKISFEQDIKPWLILILTSMVVINSLYFIGYQRGLSVIEISECTLLKSEVNSAISDSWSPDIVEAFVESHSIPIHIDGETKLHEIPVYAEGLREGAWQSFLACKE